MKKQAPTKKRARQSTASDLSIIGPFGNETESIKHAKDDIEELLVKTRRTVTLQFGMQKLAEIYLLRLSLSRLQRHSSDNMFFDKSFYEDQKTVPLYRMMQSKVTNEYTDAEKQRMVSEARREAVGNISLEMINYGHLFSDKNKHDNFDSDHDNDWETPASITCVDQLTASRTDPFSAKW